MLIDHLRKLIEQTHVHFVGTTYLGDILMNVDDFSFTSMTTDKKFDEGLFRKANEDQVIELKLPKIRIDGVFVDLKISG